MHPATRIRRIASGIALLALVTMMVPAIGAPAYAAGDEVLTKTGVSHNAGGDSSVVTEPGALIDWSLGFANPHGGSGSLSMDDPITGAQSLVPGSIEAPPGWDTSGSTATNVHVDATIPAPSTGTAEAVTSPALAFAANGATGGDGFGPLFFEGRIFNVFHHTTPLSAADIQCTEKDNGARCPGYEKALTAGGQPIATDMVPKPFIVTTAGSDYGNMYYAAQRSNDFGVGCYNLVSGTECASGGYTQLAGAGNHAQTTTNLSMVMGTAHVGNRLYFLGSEATGPADFFGDVSYREMLYCFDLTAHATCAPVNLTATQSVPGWDPGPANIFNPNNSGIIGYGQFSDLEVDGTRIYFSLGYVSGTAVGCFDTATTAACLGWASLKGVGGLSGAGMFLIDPDVAGAQGVCVETKSNVIIAFNTRSIVCFDGSGSLVPNPAAAGFAGTAPNLFMAIPYYDATLNRTFFPLNDGGISSVKTEVGCFDWTTDAQCPNFPQRWDNTNPVTGEHAIDNGFTTDYTYATDPSTGCLWALGDHGQLFTFDGVTGANPCLRFITDLTVTPSTGYYCDGRTDHVRGWDAVTLDHTDPADYQTIRVTVEDGNGVPVPGYEDVDITATGRLDISGIDFATHPTLHASVHATATNGDPWDANNTPIASMTFVGDAPQVCYQTRVDAGCPATDRIDNEATAKFTDLVNDQDLDAAHGFDLDLPATCAPDLVVTKDDGQTDVSPGQSLIYAITVTNAGLFDATGVELADTVPSGLTPQSVTGTDGNGAPVVASVSGAVVSAGPFDLPVGKTATFSVTATVDSGVTDGQVLSNTAVATDDGTHGADLDPADNSATDVDTARRVELSISKDDGRTVAYRDQLLTYTVAGMNRGGATATGVVVTDTIPVDTVFVAASDGGTEAGGVVTWPTTSLGSGATFSHTVTVRVTTTVTDASTIVNRAHIADDGTHGPETNLADNDTSDTDAVQTLDVGITKSDGRTTVAAGETLTYSLHVTNHGSAPADGVVVQDPLPVGVEFVGGSDGATTAGGVVTWPAFSLAGGASRDVTVTVRVGSGVAAGTAIVNPASVADDGTHGPDTDLVNNVTSDTDRVVEHDLSIAKTDGVTAVGRGRSTTYTVTVTNRSTVDPATTVRIRDVLPAGLAFERASDGGTESAGTVTWPTFDLAPGESRTFTVTARVATTLAHGETITNVVSVSDDGTHGADRNPSDDTASDTDTVDRTLDVKGVEASEGSDGSAPRGLLAFTGSSVLAWVVLGAGLVAAGAGVVEVVRRRAGRDSD